MIKISIENAEGLIASHNDSTDSDETLAAWMDETWEKLAADNPYVLSMILAYIEKVKESGLPENTDPLDAWVEGVLAGLALTYKVFDRQYESDRFEKEFA